ncbi:MULTISPECIES: hypothetical protein [unclassified Anabaena]|uniref:hypothetical protein n=1 Tax=unclassified Anabaena TaxID=2619674 RepID=UPI0039C74F3E
MGRWTPLILMAGGMAILMGTLLGINFPMGGQQTASNNAPGGRTSRVLPANINVNSSAPSRSTNGTATPGRGGVAQDSFSAPDNRSSVAQSNDSFSTPGTTTGTRTTTAQTTTTPSSTANQNREPIRALW